MSYCMHCGKEISGDAQYCTGCGHRNADMPAEYAAFSGAAAGDVLGTGIAGQAAAPFSDMPAQAAQTAAPFSDMPADGTHPGAPEPAPASFSGAAAGGAMSQSIADAAVFEPATPAPYRGVFPEAEPYEQPVKKEKGRKAARPRAGAHPHSFTFLDTGMGLVLALVLLCAVVFLSVIAPQFFTDSNLMAVVKQCALFSLLAIAATLTTRAGGPDLSIAPCIGMSAVIIAQTILMGGSTLSGVLLAASAALVLGLINGFAVVFFKTPALIVTFASGVMVSGVSMALTQGRMLSVTFSQNVTTIASSGVSGILALLGAAFLLGFLYHLLTKAGRPFAERRSPSISYMFAYLASAEIAAAAGFILLVRLQTVSAAADIQVLTFVIFVYALLTACRALDNRFAPVLFALVPGIIWGLLSGVFSLWGVYAYYQPVITGVLTLICLMLALLSRHERKRNVKNIE